MRFTGSIPVVGSRDLKLPGAVFLDKNVRGPGVVAMAGQEIPQRKQCSINYYPSIQFEEERDGQAEI
jgi:hypothetical protein